MFSRRSEWNACLLLLSQAALARAAIQIPPLRTLVPEIRSNEGTNQVADTLREASKQFQAGQHDKCFELLQSAKKAQANLPPPRLMLARLFLSARRIPEGRAHLEQAAVDEPRYPGLYVTFGNLALAEGRLTDAPLCFEKAAALVALRSLAMQGSTRYVGAPVTFLFGMVTSLECQAHWSRIAARKEHL